MAGILNNRTRIIDVIVTPEGRRQMYSGRFKAEFASFSDISSYYESDLVSGSSDLSNRITFESTSLPCDKIVPEFDDSGRLLGFETSNNTFTSMEGGILTSSLDSSGNYVLTPATGSSFSSLAENFIQESINNFNALKVIGSLDKDSRSDKIYNLNTTEDKLFFSINNRKPFGKNPNKVIVDETSIEPIFVDKKLAHLPNFKFLPPVNADNTNYNNYINYNQVEYTNFEDLIREIGILPFDNTQIIQDKLKDNIKVSKRLPQERTGVLRANQILNDTLVERKSVIFENIPTSANFLTQIYEINNTQQNSNPTFKKLDVIDFGEFRVDNDDRRPFKRVFFVGKIFINDINVPSFINLFTLIFD
jgi:hypothetical protein